MSLLRRQSPLGYNFLHGDTSRATVKTWIYSLLHDTTEICRAMKRDDVVPRHVIEVRRLMEAFQAVSKGDDGSSPLLMSVTEIDAKPFYSAEQVITALRWIRNNHLNEDVS